MGLPLFFSTNLYEPFPLTLPLPLPFPFVPSGLPALDFFSLFCLMFLLPVDPLNMPGLFSPISFLGLPGPLVYVSFLGLPGPLFSFVFKSSVF